MQKENLLGYDEVVDTAADAIEAAQAIREALADGLDLSDVGAVFKAAPRLVEIYRDRNTFVAQLADLTPEESLLAAAAIAERTNIPNDRVLEKANEALFLLARTHQAVIGGVDLAQDWIEWGKSLRPDANAEN